MKFIFIHLLFCSLLFSSIIDISSKNISLQEPKKIIAIGPGALRLVTMMNLSDRVIGIEKIEHKAISFSEYRSILGKKKIKSLPVIGQGGPGKLPNLEQLITLKPDLIVASFIGKKQLRLISEKTGIPIVSLSYGLGYGGVEQKLDAIKSSLKLLGKIFDKQQRAKQLISFMSTQEQVLSAYKIKNKKLYIGGIGFKGAHGITSSEKNYPSFELLGIKNTLAKDAKTNHIFIQEESLLSYNPDIIFLDTFGKKIIKENLNAKLPFYSSLQAYKNKKIHWLLAYNFYNTNISNVYINSWIILHKLGYEIDIKDKMRKIYDTFYTDGAKKLLPARYPISSF